MPEDPLQIIADNDPEFVKLLDENLHNAFPENGIPYKYKLLMALSLDASKGAVNGVRSLALQALDAGATKEEIMQTIRITQYICGIGSVYVAANALQDVL
ncbi:carboxymuconolactone decarboxylase family protein [Methanococcoides sp. SA1]|uniref:Protein disulfide reductase n=1 Tax=Methanococcoides burtonii (strain DSM 6242 / NBRC 107633 / OCM 468 / ACE-M) TaxID=259564 RepID=Q12TP8_METBU|nr:carboxymuconolactone decarboxylase family protein [Methanococcoides burtonii]ABE53178.1 protein disulfide reductase [Methanococcoides burtonii DSM 6242]MCD4808130.1 carboxymuconolactone decarboxylase family protein [Methanococcoides sp.]NPE30741.1 carboxymuconolactone decarboxylase family protein [Methanococcoides sp. SA1]